MVALSLKAKHSMVLRAIYDEYVIQSYIAPTSTSWKATGVSGSPLLYSPLDLTRWRVLFGKKGVGASSDAGPSATEFMLTRSDPVGDAVDLVLRLQMFLQLLSRVLPLIVVVAKQQHGEAALCYSKTSAQTQLTRISSNQPAGLLSSSRPLILVCSWT